MLHDLFHSADHLISSDGAWWILGLNGILLIPLIFAVFFYPTEMLTVIGAVLVLMVAVLVFRRGMLARHGGSAAR